ncbi:MmgE/PrpD family protein [Pollutimonas bauzanensis]|uniref:2-methylcitrate dehydratase PrpD n=1 Tax=Pollutimonas bauzanensis TaxID=658167 RepID=A0A1M5TIG3_9BURK|nr:MmgE/PrpD family protein [Pollutimonas bauzanensis]SHH50153.1 2-methylcitrate dehydratase PrpD [Pollutimonas bauzanensis]
METKEPETIRTAALEVVTTAMIVPSGSFSDVAMVKAKSCLLDYLSCAFEALTLPWSRQAFALATPTAEGAHMVGRSMICSPGAAAFANAVAGHGLVREDMHPASVVHLGVVVWPVVLALSEQHRVSGRQALAAAIVGYEVGARIGRAAMSSDLARLFRPTGLMGPFAAALAGARIAGLDTQQALSAFALAANCCSGLNEWPHTGGSEMYFHPGFVVKNALTCLELAGNGALASASILEGEGGFFQAYARTSMASPIVLFPEGDAEILSVFNKPVPACNFAQSPCQAALEAARRIGGDSRRIAAVRIDTTLAAVRYPGCAAKGPFRYALQAKMSIPFGVAATLARGAIEEGNYSNLDDGEIARLMSGTTLASDGQYTAAFPARQGARVTLSLDDGTSVVSEMDDVVAADSELIRRRFRQAASAVVGAQRAMEIEDIVDRLDTEPDAGVLAMLCAA